MSVPLRISDARLDELIAEDVPYIDLTSEVLGTGDAQGSIEYFTREACVLCCTEEVERIMGKLCLEVDTSNTPALGLYLRMGFEVEGTLRREVHMADGSYRDLYIMAKFLDE